MHNRIINWLLLLGPIVGCSGDDEQPDSVDQSSPQVVSKSNDENFLSDSERKYLWDVEHLGFVIEQTVFSEFKKAIRKKQLHDVRKYFSEDFRCQVPKELGTSSFLDHRGTYQKYRQFAATGAEDKQSSPEETSVKIDGFQAWLAKLRGRFGASVENCSASLGLVRLYPTERLKLDGSWVTVWKLRLAGWMDDSPVEVETRIEFRLKKLDEDIAKHEGWIESGRVLKFDACQSQGKLMTEFTNESGIDQERLHDNWQKNARFFPNTGGVYLADYNQDGLVDLLVDDVRFGAALYKGLGNGKFQDVTEEAGLKRPADDELPLWTVSSWADLDNDGDEDLIVEDRVYSNQGDGTFKDVSKECGLQLAPSAGYAIADFNNDGLVDVYVCHSGKYRPGQEEREKISWIDDGLGIDNVLWLNKGNWQFDDVTREWNAGASGSSCFAAVCLDANLDGRQDIFAINEFGRNSLLINTPDNKFVESDVDQVFGGFSMGVTAGDINNDGLDDIYVGNMYSKAGNRILANVDRKTYPTLLYDKIVEGTTGNKLYLAANKKFAAVDPDSAIADVGWAYGPTCFDLNADGWLDLYATAGFKSVTRGKPDG